MNDNDFSSQSRSAASRENLIQVAVVAGAVLALVAAIWSASFPTPFPILEFLLTVAAAAATREFGLGLPGKGFASFVLGVLLFAILRHGWGWAVVVALVGMPAGDLIFRRLPLRGALSNVGHLTVGSAIVGFAYQQMGGAYRMAALDPSNALPLLFLLAALPVLVNATFYLQLTASSTSIAWVDARLTLRWEFVVYVLSGAAALAWLWAMSIPAPAAWRTGSALLLIGASALAHWVARTGVHADELALIHRLARAIAGDISLARNFSTIQDLTRRLVPWHEMGFARYDEARHEMEVIADTAGGSAGGPRYHADLGLTGEAIRLKHPVVRRRGRRIETALAEEQGTGSEILIPLYQGERLVGAWSIRHADPSMYRDVDAALLNSLAPNLALTLRLNALIGPLLDSSEQTAQYIEHLTATSQQIHASSQEVSAATQRAETGAAQAATLVGRAEAAMQELKTSAHEAARAGDDTHRAAQQLEESAQSVRTATSRTAAALERIGETVQRGAEEVGRLREAADQVGHFAETIGTIANQTNMLALNATIEAARAGAHGAGFAVVADEVRRLAEQSAREAAQAARTTSETRHVLDHAAQLLERMREELGDIAATARGWIGDLESMVKSSETAAALSSKMIEFPRRNTLQAEEMQRMLSQLRGAAERSSAEAQAVAAAASQQLSAIESLSKSAIQLSGNAEQLARAARFVRD